METPLAGEGAVPAAAALAAVCLYALAVGVAVLLLVTAVGMVVDAAALRTGLQLGSAAAVVVAGGIACLPALSHLGLVRVEAR